MATEQAKILRPETLVEEFRKNGVTHVITIPDSETNYLYELMLEQPWLDIVPVSREGETFGIALGMVLAYGVNLWLMDKYELPRLPAYFLPFGAAALWILGQIAVLGPALRAAAVPPAVATRNL